MSTQSTLQHFIHARFTYEVDSPQHALFAKQTTIQHVLALEGADEEEKKPHLHLHCEVTISESTFRRKVKSWFPAIKGNGEFSVREKTANIVGYYYTCKGTGPDWETGKPTIISTSFTEDQIKEFHRIYWNKKQEQKVDLTAAIEEGEKPTKKRQRTKTFMEKIRDQLIEENPDREWTLTQSVDPLESDLIELSEYLYKKLGQSVKNIDQTIFNRMLNGLYAGLPKSSEREREEVERFANGYVRSRLL